MFISAKAELKIGSTPLRNFEEAQEVLVRDHCPDTKSKWRRGKIIACLGPLTYKVSVDHQTQMAHVDHLLPADSLPSYKEEDVTTESEQKCDERSEGQIH